MPLDPRSRLGALYQLWASKLDGRRAPSRGDFLAEELGPWMGHISLVDVVGPPRRFLLRLIGTNINDYDGTDHTGRYLDDVVNPAVRDLVLGHYGRCAETMEPRAYRYEAASYRDYPAVIDKLILPLSADGQAVGCMVSCIYANFERTQESLFPSLRSVTARGAAATGYHPDELPKG